jgi:aminoglycoside phosphotransferase (APT) family kinase protein
VNADRTHLRPDTAQSILEAVRPGLRVIDVVTRTGGEVSAVHEVRAAGALDPLIVKVYARRWRPKLIKEVYIYRVLARHGIRHIPRVLHAAPFGIPELPFAYAVMTRLEGRPLSEVGGDLTGADLAGVYHRMGQLLAAIHRIAQDRWGYVTTRVVDARPTNTAYMTDQFARRLRDFIELGGDPVLARGIVGHVDRHAGLFAACSGPVLCHNDFHDGNVLAAPAEGRWTVTGYVDVEGAVAADPLFDVARTDYHALRDDPARRGAFLAGYGPLPPDWTDRVALYRIHHALELWNWAAVTGKAADRTRAQTDLEQML